MKVNKKMGDKPATIRSLILSLHAITQVFPTPKFVIQSIIIVISIVSFSHPQAIQFSIYVDSELTATTEQDLNFGDFIVAGQGLTEVNLGDPTMGKFRITGNEEMDIIVTTVVPSNLTESGGGPNLIPLTLNMAYNNKGADNPAQAVTIVGGTARIPMKVRASGHPAGPPPTPPHSEYIPADADVFLYIYGNINIGSVAAGLYTATVSITVEYD
ncbi:MAG: hypothetical protein HQ509_12120 [Candidatus Marinimicrobia bacterium]|nr:hypothetical protein [Candidatus Neomarinimicrobiota bacterium]